MKNLTIQLEDETHTKFKTKASEKNLSMKDFLLPSIERLIA